MNINKFKNIAHRGVSLILALTMMIPTGVFAATQTEYNWVEYKDELKSGIMKQVEVINIDFGNGIRYASEGLAIQAITEAYNKAIGEIPNYFEINIEDSKQSPIIENLSGSYLLKEVRYDVTYYNDFTEINNELSELYADINTKTKYHEKISLAYDSIIEKLHYKSGSTNHEILVGSPSKDWNNEASSEAYAMLFSIIMDKLGYENLIITGKIKEGSTTQGHAWNLVKVQGKWYHVDSKLGDVNYFDGDRENFFLTSFEKMRINYEHAMDEGYPEEYKTGEEYDENDFIDNEIEFILQGFEATTEELKSLKIILGIDPDTEGIKDNIDKIDTLEELTDTKNKFNDIKSYMELINKKILGYENNINVLDSMGLEYQVEDLRTLLNDLKVIANIDEELNEIEQKILVRENQILAKDAKVLVEIAQNKVLKNENEEQILPEGSISSFMTDLEGDVKKAKAEVKGVKDSTIKDDLEKTLDDIDIIIKALKSVNTLEGATKSSSSSINKAKNAINLIAENYEVIKNELNDRVNKIDDAMKVKDAEELVAKAENSLRKADYDKANTAVEKLKNEGIDKYYELNKRVEDILEVITAKETVENAERLMKANKEKRSVYEDAVETAIEAYNRVNNKYNSYGEENEMQEYNEKYGELIEILKIRIEDMQTTIAAIKRVDTAAKHYDAYIGESTNENEQKLSTAIKKAKNAVSSINDRNANLTNIKKSLNNELKIMSDRLEADKDSKEISNTISDLETSIVDTLLAIETAEKKYETISKLDDRIASIEPLLKEVKDKRKSDEFKERITALKDVLAATKAVVDAEESDVKTVSKKITTATKAIEKLNNTSINYRIKKVKELKENLEQRIFVLNKKIETKANEANARKLVDKALNSKKESDIKSAIEAIAQLENGGTKDNLKKEIEDLVDLLLSDTEVAILTTITNIERKNNNKLVTKNFTEVQKAVSLAENIVIFANEKLIISDFEIYKASIEVLNKDIEILDNSILALNAVQQAEKSKTKPDVTIAQTAIGKIDVANEDDKFFDMKSALDKRIEDINKYLEEIEGNEELAIKAVEDAELPMKPTKDNPEAELELSDFKYEAGLVLAAKAAIKNVHDKNIRKDLESRILALETAQAAIVSFNKAKVYPIENNIKDAEASLGKVGSGYFSLIEVLNKEIAELYNNLNKSKSEAYKDADTAIINSNEVIKRLNRYIAGLIGPEELPLPEEMTSGDGDSSEGFDKDIAYGRVRVARNYLMDANDAVLKLSNSNEIKSLTSRIKSAHEYIDEVDDKIDVKEAIRLVDIVSDSVNATNSETDKDKKQRLKEEADLNIRDAKLAISRIDHKDNKEIKSTITKNLSLIEKRLMSNNDQELIETAYELVNTAANLLANAVKEDEVTDKSLEIGNAIWAANLAIVGISNDNKDAKAALQRFIDEISDLFELEKGIIANEDRIKNAREAVEVAEKYDGNNEDERYGLIRSARLRVNIIRNTDPDTKAIIDELNLRLDILEGKAGSGGSGSDVSGGNSGGGKGGSGSDKPGTTPINKIPSNPISNSKRVIGTGTAEPNWGRTKELKKSVPVTGVSYQDMEAIKAYESRLLIAELSNVLNNTQTNNTKILVRGNNISLDSKPYILDKVSNSVLLPIKLLGDELGFTVSLTESPVAYGPKRLFISGFVNGEVKSIIMDIGSNYCYINGFVVMISSSPVIQDGRAYIPVDLLIEHLGLNVSYYNDRGNIQLIIN